MEVKERMFPDIAGFGDPNSFLNFMKEQRRRPDPLIRTILWLKLCDFEIIYPEEVK